MISDERLREIVEQWEAFGLDRAVKVGFGREEYDIVSELLSARQTIADLESAWMIDETIQPDGSLRPSISDTIARYEKTMAEKDALIVELKADGERLLAHTQHLSGCMTYQGYECDCGLSKKDELHIALLKKMEVKE